jgi:O-antigen/teichoic acid export membrane protein
VTEPVAFEDSPAAGSRGARIATLVGMRDVGRALRDFATYLPTQAIPAVAGFLVLPVLARRLAPTDLGILALAQTLITLGWTAIGSWLTQVIIRELPAAREQNRVRSFALTFRRAIGLSALAFSAFLVLIGLGAAVSDAIASNLVLIAIATAGLTIQNFAVSLYAASFRPVSFAVVDVLARTGGIAVGVALVFLGHGVQGYLLGLGVMSTVVGVVGLYFAWPVSTDTQAPAPGALSKWVRYGVPSSLAGIVLWGLFFIDRYLLAIFRSTHEVGVYSVGSAIGDKAVTLPTMAFFTAAGPLLVAAYERQGRTEVERLMREYTRVILLMGLPTVAFLVATSGILVPALAGARYYHEAARVTPLIAVGSLIYVLALVSNTGLVIAKKTLPLAASAGVGLVVNIVANIALIPPFGIIGSAIATPIGMAAYLIALQFAARRHARWKFPVSTLLRASTAAGIATVAAGAVATTFHSGAPQVATIALLGGALYITVLAALGEHRVKSPSAALAEPPQ